MISGIVFDLDDTLYDYKSYNKPAIKRAMEYCSNKTDFSIEDCENAFNIARKETKEVLGDVAACHNRLIYFQKTLELLGLKPACIALEMYEEYWGYMLDNIKLNCGAKQLLDFCKSNGIIVGICTDLTVHIQHRKLRKLGISDYIDVLVTSEEAGVEKPDMRMFELVHKKMGTEKSKTWFVGDSLKKDVMGARDFGYTSLYYCENSKDDERAYNFSNILDMIKNEIG